MWDCPKQRWSTITIRRKDVDNQIRALSNPSLRVLIVVLVLMLATTALPARAETPISIAPVESTILAIADPLTLLRMFCDFLRAGQIDAAVNLLADDVVLIETTGQSTAGKDAVRAWLSRLDFDEVELCDIWLYGNQIAWTVRVYHADAEKIGSGRALIENGKIQWLVEVSW